MSLPSFGALSIDCQSTIIYLLAVRGSWGFLPIVLHAIHSLTLGLHRLPFRDVWRAFCNMSNGVVHDCPLGPYSDDAPWRCLAFPIHEFRCADIFQSDHPQSQSSPIG